MLVLTGAEIKRINSAYLCARMSSTFPSESEVKKSTR